MSHHTKPILCNLKHDLIGFLTRFSVPQRPRPDEAYGGGPILEMAG